MRMPLNNALRRLPGRLRSVRTRLVLWNILALAVMLAFLGLFVRYTVQATMMASVDRELTRAADRFVRPPGPPEDGGPPGRGPGGPPNGLDLAPFNGGGPPDGGPNGPPFGPGAGTPFRRGLRRGGEYPPRLLGLDGKDVDPSANLGPWDKAAFIDASRGRRVFTTIRSGSDRLRILSQPLPPRGIVARVVQVPYPLADVDRAIAGLNATLFTLIPVALLFAGLGGSLLTGRALGPVRRITQTAGRISARDLSERLPASGDDEFAELAATFNGMLSRLELSFSQQERLVEELRALVEQQRRFTADASHELRTPLTVIKANASLALETRSSADDLRQAMGEIDRAADAASLLVRDLLLLARSDAGQLGRNTITIPIREVLQRVVSDVQHGVGPAPRLEPVDPALCVTGNEDELARLFTNLLENAIRYTPPEGTVTASVDAVDGDIRVRIADTGCGIAAEHLPHLGERFYRVDPSRTRQGGGAGLGLSICKSLVEAHGGRMAFESEPGKGTIVTVNLPAA